MMQLLNISRTLVLLLFAVLLFHKFAWSASHIEIRNVMIRSHLAQMNGPVIMVVGDSIVESWLGGKLGSCSTLNAGLGGAEYGTWLPS
jgi:hypothetical protein